LGLSKLAPRWFYGMPMVEWSHDETRAVDQVIGAFFFVRRHWYSQLQGFDQRFFVYFEEVDFCKRLIDHGQRVMYLASAKAFHRGGGTSEQVKAHRLFYSRRSRIQYSHKHFSRLQALTVTTATLVCEPLLMVIRGMIHRSPREISETLFGFRMLWADLANCLRSHPDAVSSVHNVSVSNSTTSKAA
jgi:N-acetylglucosaminyl-diphospho-decaprenol L-rhamnosyltransferase